MSSPGTTWSLIGLGADAPLDVQKEKLSLFGQFVGDWVGEATFLKDDGSEISGGRGEVHLQMDPRRQGSARRVDVRRPIYQEDGSPRDDAAVLRPRKERLAEHLDFAKAKHDIDLRGEGIRR